MRDDAAVREEALASTGNLVVTAGAGTGKTTLLLDKVIALLLVRGLELRRILMMTFTEKAANEMRNRLETELRRLDRAKWEARGAREFEARRARALADLDRAEIGTIHSFCAHVLREYPVEAGLDPGFEVDEGGRLDDLFRREWPRWLDGELGPNPPRGAHWRRILKKVRLQELEQAARELCSFRIPLDAMNRRKGAALFESTSTTLAVRLEALASRGPEKSNLTIQLRELARALRTGEGEFSEQVSGAQKGWGAELEEAKSAAKEALPLAKARSTADARLLDDAVALLAEFARAFRARYTREGWVSFDGLLLLVRDLLTSGRFPGIRCDLQEKYDFVLVDEFQDTDPVQGEIVLFLAEDGRRAARASDVRIRPGKLMIVGDPKQSIYSFRGADIVAYEHLKEQILRQGGRPVVLSSNFRSQERIVDAVNALFPRIIVPNGLLQPAYDPILPTRPAGPEVELLLLQSDEPREAEADAIARRIRDERMAWKDVAVLLKALTDVHRIVEAFRTAGIEYVVEGEKYFYATQEIVDFANLLGAIANPADRIALAGVLRSPVGAVDDRTLYEIRTSLDYRKPAPREELRDFWEMLRDEHGRASRSGVAEFVNGLLERTFVLETAAAGVHGEQAVANLLKLAEAARAYEASTGGTLAGFLARVRTAMTELQEEGESPLADENLDAVKILSVHKSKGLQFPIVFLPDLHRQTRGGGDPPAVRFDWTTQAFGLRFGKVGDPAEAALAWHDTRRRREEARRVLYVAMTRAKDRMILSGGADYKEDSFLGILESAGALDLLKVERRSVSPIAPPRPEREEEPKEPPQDWTEFHEAWRRRESAKDAPRFTSVTQLEAKEKREAPRGVSRGAEIGIECHAVLETLDFAKPLLPPMDPEARKILEGFLPSSAFRELAESEILARELPILLPHGEQILEGYIDVVYRRRGKVYVGDYKTDVAMRPDEYAPARDVYVRAVRDSLGVDVARFRLFYLRHGTVVEV